MSRRSKAVLLGVPILALLGLVIGVLVVGNRPEKPLPEITGTANWELVELGETLTGTLVLQDVSMIDMDNAWVVGRRTTADVSSLPSESYYNVLWRGIALRLMRQNGKWAVAETHDLEHSLLAVAAVSKDEIWALSEQYLNYESPIVILRKDSNGWHELPTLVPRAIINTIYFSPNGEESWIGGEIENNWCHSHCLDAVLLRFQNGEWRSESSLEDSGLYNEVNGIDFVGGIGYATGKYSISRYEGGRWVLEALPPYDCSDPRITCDCVSIYQICERVGPVSTTDGEEVWAISWRLLQRVNGQWEEPLASEVPLGQPDLAGHSVGYRDLDFGSINGNPYGFVVGQQSTDLTQSGWPYVLRYTQDRRWYYESVPVVEGGRLMAVSAVGPDDALAVGSIFDKRGQAISGIILSKSGSPQP